jgi:glycosyltransferase involved in cell wall biosynthesis
MKKLSVSIVIPVYNEAAHLGACLQAIADQTILPDEVIVVDNNSTDDTVAVAGQYQFVRVLHENRQGVVYARDCGFNAANGELIGRIDADTIVSSDWVDTLQAIFSDPNVDAVSGAVSYHDLPYRDFFAGVDLRFRQAIARGMADEVFLYGANMAIRRKTWRQVRQEVCQASGLHEDFDVGINAQEVGARVVFDKRLRAAVSLRQFDSTLRDFWQYVWLNPKTYALHGRTSQRHMYPAIILVVMFYGPLRLLHRSYDPGSLAFSWQKLWSPAAQIRVNPATFVD